MFLATNLSNTEFPALAKNKSMVSPAVFWAATSQSWERNCTRALPRYPQPSTDSGTKLWPPRALPAILLYLSLQGLAAVAGRKRNLLYICIRSTAWVGDGDIQQGDTICSDSTKSAHWICVLKPIAFFCPKCKEWRYEARNLKPETFTKMQAVPSCEA
jgi:hypothetical protein